MKRILVIAEAGVNHNGSMDLACQLIDAAAAAGADYVKFQTWNSSGLASKDAGKAEYQKSEGKPDESMLSMVKRLEFPYENFIHLKEHCRKMGIGFLSSPFDKESARFLYSMGVDLMKIPSGEITNLPFLEVVSEYPCPIIMSTGMCEMQEIKDAVAILQRKVKKEITVLHCNTQYPTPVHDVNLLSMLTLKKELELPVGLSDHSPGVEVPIAAAALGAEVIEKHLTLNRQMEGPDHKASMEPEEFQYMVRCIRNIELALGSGLKQVTASERENRNIARKSIFAAKRIGKGERFTQDNLAVKRPGTGISPMKWYEVIGKTAQRDFEEDELIVIDSE